MADLVAELEELKRMLGTSANSTQRQARAMARTRAVVIASTIAALALDPAPLIATDCH